jgi:hypothetical protein
MNPDGGPPLDGVPFSEAVIASQAAWHETRAYLRSHQDELAVAARLVYPQTLSVAGTSLITRPEWLPDSPRPLDRVHLEWRPGPAAREVTGPGPTTAHLRPMAHGSAGFLTYADAVRELAAPVVFEDRARYWLLSANLAGDGVLSLGRGTYFDGINAGAASARRSQPLTNSRPPTCEAGSGVLSETRSATRASSAVVRQILP